MRIYKLCFLLILSCFLACNENMPEIACLSCDTGTVIPNADERVVLIEEFTGIRCVSCPQGSAAIEDFLVTLGGRLVPVSIHTGFFSKPFMASKYDFGTDDGDAILALLGDVNGYPSAVINRTQYPQSTNLQLELTAWSNAIQQELATAPDVNLILSSDFSGSDRTLNISLEVIPLLDLNDLYVTVMITESGVVDIQKTPQIDQDPNYVHKHILRDVVTNTSGDLITQPLEAGKPIQLNFKTTLSEEWVAANSKVVAFVHRSGSTQEVLQATQKSIAD